MQYFRTVELDTSVHRWPRTTAFASWRRLLPPGFQRLTSGSAAALADPETRRQAWR